MKEKAETSVKVWMNVLVHPKPIYTPFGTCGVYFCICLFIVHGLIHGSHFWPCYTHSNDIHYMITLDS